MANKKKVLQVDVSNVKVRGSWNGIKPYTRVQTPKTAYSRKGRRRDQV